LLLGSWHYIHFIVKTTCTRFTDDHDLLFAWSVTNDASNQAIAKYQENSIDLLKQPYLVRLADPQFLQKQVIPQLTTPNEDFPTVEAPAGDQAEPFAEGRSANHKTESSMPQAIQRK
jgi:hypothetical protein